jgi:predicted ATPase
MKPAIRRLILRGFRSVRDATIEFDNPTLFVGRNGAGKSNLLDALAFLRDAMESTLGAVFDRRGGIGTVRNRSSFPGHPPNLGMAVEMAPADPAVSRSRYAFEVAARENRSFEVVREQCVVDLADGTRHFFDRRRDGPLATNVDGVRPAVSPDSLLLPLVAGDERFATVRRTLSGVRVHSIEPAKIRELQDPDVGSGLKRDGSNAAAVLMEVERESPETMTRIAELLRTVEPGTVALKAHRLGNKLTIQFEQAFVAGGKPRRLKFDAYAMSDGTLRATGILAAVYQRPTPVLAAFEEPESTLHPGALGAVIELLRGAADDMQIVATTHSPDLLEADWIEAKHLRLVQWEDGSTKVVRPAESVRAALQSHLMNVGELLRADALQGEPLFEQPETPELFEAVA